MKSYIFDDLIVEKLEDSHHKELKLKLIKQAAKRITIDEFKIDDSVRLSAGFYVLDNNMKKELWAAMKQARDKDSCLKILGRYL